MSEQQPITNKINDFGNPVRVQVDSDGQWVHFKEFVTATHFINGGDGYGRGTHDTVADIAKMYCKHHLKKIRFSGNIYGEYAFNVKYGNKLAMSMANAYIHYPSVQQEHFKTNLDNILSVFVKLNNDDTSNNVSNTEQVRIYHIFSFIPHLLRQDKN